jgi:hypothetical protein
MHTAHLSSAQWRTTAPVSIGIIDSWVIQISVDKGKVAVMKALGRKVRRTLAVGALCTLSTFVTNAGAQTQASFVAHKEFPVGINPVTFAQGDLNGDGITDLVFAEFNIAAPQPQVVELLGNPDGSFQPPVVLNTGTLPSGEIVIADFNGDGKNDLAIAQIDGVIILLGDGKGGFGAPQTVASTTLAPLLAGDFNGDHKIDLVQLEKNSISLLLGNGDGTFRAPITTGVADSPIGIAAGDFNGDGRLDLAVIENFNSVAILLNDGKDHFQAAPRVLVADGLTSLTTADMNHDGKLDVVLTNTNTDQVSVLLGNGDGSLQPAKSFTVRSGPPPVGGYQPNSVSVADFNGDGKPDVVVSNRITSTAAVLLGDGKGNLGKPVNFLVAAGPIGVMSGDYNHDGKQDFMAVNGNAGTVSVFSGLGNGKFEVEAGFGTPARANQIRLADFNEDGIPDIAAINSGPPQRNSHSATVLIGKKGGIARTTVVQAGINPINLVTGDVNNDGHTDLVVTNGGSSFLSGDGTLSIILGNGDGTFQPTSTVKIIQPPPANFARNPRYVAAADFNNDGNLDLVACTDDAEGPSMLLGDGKGGFAAPLQINLGQDCLQVEAADLNRDGKQDLVIRVSPGPFQLPEIFVALGNGDGTFQKPKVLTNDEVFGFTIADLNNDGIPDLVLAENGATKALLGEGNGKFSSKGFFPGPGFDLIHNFVNPVIADFNGDGFVDVALPAEFGPVTTIVLGKGDGTFEKTLQLYAGGGDEYSALTAGDLNGDGKIDLVLSAFDSLTGHGIVTELINNTAR